MSSPATATSHSDFLRSRGAVLDEAGVFAAHFGDPATEITAFTSSAALVDRPGTTCLVHEGEDALDLLHRLSTSDLLSLEHGQGRFTILTSERGRIIDVLHVLTLEPAKLLLLSDSMNAQPSIDWIEKFTIIEDSEIRDASDEYGRVSLIGPEAKQIAAKTFGVDITSGGVVKSEEPDGPVLVTSQWGEAERVDVVTSPGELATAWDSLVENSAAPAGDLAFEAARIAAGVPLADHELTGDANPLEVNLKDLISFTKGCYVGQEVVARLDTYDKLQRRMVAFESDSSLVPGTSLTSNSKRAGIITSVSPIKTGGKNEALGFARRDFWETGTQLEFDGGTVIVKQLDEHAPFA